MNNEISVDIVKHHKGIQIKDAAAGYSSLTPNPVVPSYPILKNTCLTNTLNLSLLSRTLPEIFQTVTHQYYLNDDPQSSISSLGIPQYDIDCLRMIALFPDDPADVLFWDRGTHIHRGQVAFPFDAR